MDQPRFCTACGGKTEWAVPPDDHTERHWCPACGHVQYDNPIPVVLVVLHTDERVLMIRRAIPPYVDRWAPPGGFIDHGESIDAAALREVKEETGIDVEAESLIPYSIISIPDINQICFVCRSRVDDEIAPVLGDETADAQWFSKDEMPFGEYFLPAHQDGLETFFDSIGSGRFRIYMAEASFDDGFNRSIRIR